MPKCPASARGIFKTLFFNFEKKNQFLPMGFQKKISANLVQPFGQLESQHINIQERRVLLYRLM